MKNLRIPAMFLAAVLQLLPICRTVCTSPAASSAYAIIFRWAVGATAGLGAFDAVSGASVAVTIDGPTNATGAVNSPFTYFITLSGDVKGDPGAVVLATPLPAGLSNYTHDGYSESPPNVYGVITGIPSAATTNFTVNITTYHPSIGFGPASTLSLTILSSAVSPTINNQPTNVSVSAGSSGTFTVNASGTAPLTYQWYKGNTNITSRVTFVTTNNTYTTTNAGTYIARIFSPGGNIDSSPATLSVSAIAPVITNQPANVTVTAGSNATFSVTAGGTAPLKYQWRFNVSSNIVGATNSSYTITNAQPVHAGNYTVVITNSAGSITSSPAASLTVNVPPGVSAAPTNLTVTAGQSAAFNVTATGTAPLSYQWRKGGTPISGATATNYTVANVRAADAGSFTVVITNIAGSITSSPAATLTVNNPAPPVAGTPLPQGGQFLFTFTPVVGLTNTVLTNSVAAPAGWVTMTNIPPPATASSITVTDTVAGPARFYRVQVVP